MLLKPCRMFLYHVVLATLAFICFVDGGVVSPHRPRSNGDQYREGAVGDVGPQVKMARFNERDATDRGLLSAKDVQRSLIAGNQRMSQKTALSYEDILDQFRNKRSYYPFGAYNFQIPQFQANNPVKQSAYILKRPTYVPVIGLDDKIPIYFPPQSFFINTGISSHIPIDQPYGEISQFPPMTYLPPVPQAPNANAIGSEPPNNSNRDDDIDERPLWGYEINRVFFAAETTMKPSVKPTRKKESNKMKPPLVHKDSRKIVGKFNHLSMDTDVDTTNQSSDEKSTAPSKCVWAIISCCSTSTKEVNYKCFNQLGCFGPFWDSSPCDRENAKAAIDSALSFYNS